MPDIIKSTCQIKKTPTTVSPLSIESAIFCITAKPVETVDFPGLNLCCFLSSKLLVSRYSNNDL